MIVKAIYLGNKRLELKEVPFSEELPRVWDLGKTSGFEMKEDKLYMCSMNDRKLDVVTSCSNNST